ncbi:MAG: flavodoxin domain-containing protein [Bacteroidota bacterium]
MKTAIYYISKHGTTKTCAEELKKHLTGDTTLIAIDQESPDPSQFDRVILGGSIYMGEISRKMKSFIKKHTQLVNEKVCGLFICCMYEGEKALEQFTNAYPVNLRNNAKVHGIFGGAYQFDKMNFIERKIIKKVADVEESVSTVDNQSIKEFARQVNSQNE